MKICVHVWKNVRCMTLFLVNYDQHTHRYKTPGNPLYGHHYSHENLVFWHAVSARSHRVLSALTTSTIGSRRRAISSIQYSSSYTKIPVYSIPKGWQKLSIHNPFWYLEGGGIQLFDFVLHFVEIKNESYSY